MAATYFGASPIVGLRSPVPFNRPRRPRTSSADDDPADRDDDKPAFLDVIGDWWFHQDTRSLLLVSQQGHLITANEAAEAAIREGLLAVTPTGALKFGSTECDNRFLRSVALVAGSDKKVLVILRQRHGSWFAADLHGVLGKSWAVLSLREELVATEQSMSAIAAAFQLTRSELDVLRRLLDGRCPKSAAIELHISEHTVRAHLRSIYAKMGTKGLTNTIRISCSFLG